MMMTEAQELELYHRWHLYDCGGGCGETHVQGCSHWDARRTRKNLAESCTHCDSDCKDLVKRVLGGGV